MKDKDNPTTPFHRRSIYLDLKGSPYESSLAADLKILGAKMMPMFSKDVSCVVSNRVPLKTKSSYWTPPTPVSPQNDSSMKSPASPAPDANIFPMSRGMALIQKAAQKTSSTTDILDVCKRFGVKVYHVDKMLAKVKQLKIQFTSFEKKKANVKKRSVGEKKLISPFIKLEDAQRKYKTHYKEFTSWSNVINPQLSKKITELKKSFKVSGKLDCFARPALKEINTNKPPYLHNAVISSANSSKTVSLPKFSSFPKPSDSTSVCAFAVKKNPQPPFKKHGTKKALIKKRSYCEICSKYFTGLDEHLESQKHKEFMSNPINYLAVQNIISSFSKGDSEIWKSNGELFDFQSYLTDPPETLMNLNDSLQTDFQTHYSNIPDVESFMLNPEECDTEVYSFIDPGYVSPSVATPETKKLGFLQDSFVEKAVEPSENTDNCCKSLVKMLDIGDAAEAVSMSEVDKSMLDLLERNNGLSVYFNGQQMGSGNISSKLMLDMNTQMFSTDGVLKNAYAENAFNENLLYIENAENVWLENILKKGEDISPENKLNFEYEGILNENNLKVMGFDENTSLIPSGISPENLYERYLNCIEGNKVWNPDCSENTDVIVTDVINTVLDVIVKEENSGNIDISGYTSKAENEVKVFCSTTPKDENTDEIVKSSLNCILNVIEEQENLNSFGSIDNSGPDPKVECKDMIFYENKDLSIGKRDRVLGKTTPTVENVDEIVNITLNYILTAVEDSENLGISGHTPKAESKDIIFSTGNSSSLSKVEPIISSKEINNVEIKSPQYGLLTLIRDVSSAPLSRFFSFGSSHLIPVTEEQTIEVKENTIENFVFSSDIPPKLNPLQPISYVIPHDDALDSQTSPPILIPEEQGNNALVDIKGNVTVNTKLSSDILPKLIGSQLGSDSLSFVASSFKSDGIATETPVLIKSEVLSPSGCSEDLFGEEDDAGGNSEWQVLHSQVSNLCETLNSLDES